jgi:dihydrofolate synthase / folylpolyglutamate synthase
VTYQDALDFLYPLHRFGIKPGLDRIRSLLALLGSPHQRLGVVVHIAGTNGKGSVAASLASIFQASGKKTALYTSPHLVDFTERIRIDGRPIPPRKVAHYCSFLKDDLIDNPFTFFEATTAIAFAWFADEGVDVSILETGLGGRLDATNVVQSDYAVITTIGLDHTDWLGETISLIAAEKAAIIKKGSRVFTAVSQPEALYPVQQMAESCHAPLFVAGKDSLCTVVSAAPGNLELEITTPSRYYPALKAPLTGSFHAANITLAVMVAEDAGIAAEHISSGLERLLQTGYRARLERIGLHPTILLDVSHNPDGMRETVNALEVFRRDCHRVHVLLGLASDKDARAVIRELLRLDASFVLVNIPSERSVSAEALSAMCREEGVAATGFATGNEGFAYLLARADADDLILVTGSFYLAGEILAGVT